MEYRPLGRTGVSVSQMCLGAMMFGAFGNSDHEDAIKVIHKALDAGINFIDTADGYSAGESEEILGQALSDGRRESVVLAVKFGVPFGDSDPNHRGASRRWITEAVEGSLRRLQTDWMDLYQVGVPDQGTDIDETLGALSDLVRAGKIRSFGASKVPASQIVEAQWTAERRGHGRSRTEQPPYSLLTRAIEYDVLPTCLRHGMGVMAYSPLAGGWLSGRYRKGREVSGPGSAARARRFPGAYDAANPANAAKLDAADALGALADEAGLTLIQMAIALVTRHPAVTSAIIRPRTMDQHQRMPYLKELLLPNRTHPRQNLRNPTPHQQNSAKPKQTPRRRSLLDRKRTTALPKMLPQTESILKRPQTKSPNLALHIEKRSVTSSTTLPHMPKLRPPLPEPLCTLLRRHQQRSNPNETQINRVQYGSTEEHHSDSTFSGISRASSG